MAKKYKVFYQNKQFTEVELNNSEVYNYVRILQKKLRGAYIEEIKPVKKVKEVKKVIPVEKAE